MARASSMRRQYAAEMLVSRPTPERFDETLELMQTCDRGAYGDTDWTALELREEWDEIELSTDAWLVDLDGRLAGVMHLCERRGETFIADGYVHPLRRGRGVGATMLDLAEARARERSAEVPPGGTPRVHCSHLVGDETAPVLLAGKGYVRMRSFFRMVIGVQPPPPEPTLPSGISFRPFDVATHGRALHAANEEAFVQEWSHTPEEFGAWAKRAFERPRFDPSLVVVAWAGSEIAGFSLNYPKRMGDWGWVGSLGVMPSWRRSGVGLALLHESFRRFAEAGETTVALGVDSENPTGATRLYERAGMRRLWRADVWEKVLVQRDA
jgi:mycothiol synthase